MTDRSKSKQAKGGKARAAALSSEERRAIARKGAEARWQKSEEEDIPPEMLDHLPIAKYKGYLNVQGFDIPCYVLENGQRVIGRTSATEMLTGIKGGGSLEKYLSVRALKPFIDAGKVLEGLIAFRLPEVEGLKRHVKGFAPDDWIDVCRGFVDAMEENNNPNSPFPRMSSRQVEMALQASNFLAACAKIGLDALIDEATGYQYERAENALQVKLRAYLSEEMRKWEKTFPDELWIEFARLTGWKGSVTQRPKYWGKLVNELVYEFLDPDVAAWLKENAPKPRYGQNYHQWLSEQFGLKKLIEHIWMLIGMARACRDMSELRRKMAEQFGLVPVQLSLYLPPPSSEN